MELLEHAVGVVEGVFEGGIGKKVGIDAMWFGFVPGMGCRRGLRGAADAGRCGCTGGRLCFAFVDLEKAFDGVPGEVAGWALGDGVDGALCGGAPAVVGAAEGDSGAFGVEVGLHLDLFWVPCCL